MDQFGHVRQEADDPGGDGRTSNQGEDQRGRSGMKKAFEVKDQAILDVAELISERNQSGWC